MCEFPSSTMGHTNPGAPALRRNDVEGVDKSMLSRYIGTKITGDNNAE
jgi:hypothetical protein